MSPSVPEELGTCPQYSPTGAAWPSHSRHLIIDVILAHAAAASSLQMTDLYQVALTRSLPQVTFNSHGHHCGAVC